MADEISPGIDAALSGKAAIEQLPPGGIWDKESIIAWTLYHYRKAKAKSLYDFLWQYDSINKDLPTAREVIWAFARLRDRGWLQIRRGKFEITDRGALEIEAIVGTGKFWEKARNLGEWCLGHPPNSLKR